MLFISISIDSEIIINMLKIVYQPLNFVHILIMKIRQSLSKSGSKVSGTCTGLYAYLVNKMLTKLC